MKQMNGQICDALHNSFLFFTYRLLFSMQIMHGLMFLLLTSLIERLKIFLKKISNFLTRMCIYILKHNL